MPTYESVLEDVKALSPEDRLRLIDELLGEAPDDSGLSPEWLAEIDRRSRDYDEGRTTTAPWSEVKERMERRLSERRED